MRDLILRPASACLARRLAGLRDDGGRGAVGVLVAVLIGAGVLFGMGALVIDVGQLYQNRAELQNGADAAALAVAKSCAAGTCAPSIATQYATANASNLTGGKAKVNLVCAASTARTGGDGHLPGRAKNVCPANPPAGPNYVDVETSTLLPNGSTCCRPSSPERSPGTPLGQHRVRLRAGRVGRSADRDHGRVHDLGVRLGPGDRTREPRSPRRRPTRRTRAPHSTRWSTSRAAQPAGCSTEPNGAAGARQLRLDR